VEEVGDDYLSGLLYSEMGRIYRLYYDYPKSLEAYQKAAESYERAGKISHRNYMWYYQSAVCRNMNKYDESERSLQKTLPCAKEDGDEVLIKTCIGDLVMLYVELNRTTEALVLYEQSTLLQGEFGTSSFMGVLSRLYASEGNFVKANNYLKKGWERTKDRNDSINLYLSSAMLSDKMGDGKKAYQELLVGISMQNVNVRHSLEQPILTVQKNYLSDRLEFQNYKLRMEKHFRILCILFFVVLLGIVVYVLSKKLKQEKEKARKTIDELNEEMQRKEAESHHKIASLLQELEGKHQSEAVVDGLKAELRQWDEHFRQYMKEVEKAQEQQRIREKELTGLSGKLLAGRTKLINVLLDCIYTDADNKDVVYQRLALFSEQLMKDLGSGKKAYGDLEQMVDNCYDGMMRRIRSEVQLPDEESYRQVCYHLAGFSVKSIAFLMGETPNKIYKRRDRIRLKLDSFDTDFAKDLR
jgi:tetratricopeptide (TPR) repeat protein